MHNPWNNLKAQQYFRLLINVFLNANKTLKKPQKKFKEKIIFQCKRLVNPNEELRKSGKPGPAHQADFQKVSVNTRM